MSILPNKWQFKDKTYILAKINEDIYDFADISSHLQLNTNLFYFT